MGKKALLIVLILVILALGVVGYYFISQQKAGEVVPEEPGATAIPLTGEYVGQDAAGDAVRLVLHDDKHFDLTFGEVVDSGTYKTSGSSITLTLKMEGMSDIEMRAEREGSAILLYGNNGEAMRLERE